MKYAIYHRVPTGEITNYNKLPEQWDEETVQKNLKSFNESHADTCNATIVEIEDGSFIGFLIKKVDDVKRYDEDLVREALDAIEHAESCINALR